MFIKNAKNVTKTAIFSLQLGFTGDFVPDHSNFVYGSKLWHCFFLWLYQIC